MSADHETTTSDPGAHTRFWDDLYRSRPIPWGERVNPLLTETAGALPAGSALDLGSGAGGDAVWLARRGWHVTAVDIAPTAVDGVRDLAAREGLADRITAEQHEMPHTFPAGEFDLVSAQYFHSTFPVDRTAVLRTAARALRSGGLLLLVDHGSIAPWSWNQDHHTHFPTPREIAADLALPDPPFSVVRAESPQREATGPNGETATVTDTVLVVRRSVG